jgi:acyl carrier protein
VPLGRELVELVGGQVLNMYGPTETTIWSTTHPVTGHESTTMPIGFPLSNTVAFVVDEHGRPAPRGVAGELLIGGEGVARGYHARPDLTRERFIDDRLSGLTNARLYRTGDRAAFAPDGSLEFLGRMDHQIKIRGHRVELGEIEALLSTHPGVRECAVTSATSDSGDVVMVGHIVPASFPLDVGDVRVFLKRSLPDVMVPSRFVTLDALPHTPNGKVDRIALSAVGAPRVARAAPAPPSAPVPASQLDGRIADIWREVLGLETVGFDDNFFELGGHSLSAVHVHTKLATLTNRPLSITDLFRFPTIRALAAFIGSDAGEQRGALSGQSRAQARRRALAKRQAVHE